MIRSLLAVVVLAAALPASAHDMTPVSSIDRAVIRQVIRRHLPRIRRCYKRALARQPNLAGRILVRFSIAASGVVSSAVVVQSTLKNPKMEQCVLAVVRKMIFPPHVGQDVIISYPFVFNST